LVTEVTGDVVIEKFVDAEPAGMFTVGGTWTSVLVEEIEMFTPPAGAMSLSQTVPVSDDPPVMPETLRPKPIKLSGTTVKDPWAEPPL
jgi:hypothetical protein